MTRDLIIQGLASKHGLIIVEITVRDLTIDNMMAKIMMAKIPPSLPMRRIDRKSLYLRTLQEICLEHTSIMDNSRRRQLN
ncbi:MAG TPA: hypothetical protein GX729_01740 [Firmicutes bacterium]|nr:hypothetical protein [Bacillota bacterium]